jgi:hypothetical protein
VNGVQGARSLPVEGMILAGNAFRRGPGKVCRNSLAGLVMLSVLEFWAAGGALPVTRPESKRCQGSVKQQASPCPARDGTLEAQRRG